MEGSQRALLTEDVSELVMVVPTAVVESIERERVNVSSVAEPAMRPFSMTSRGMALTSTV